MPQVQHISYQRVLLMVFLIFTPMLFPAYAFAHQAQATTGGPTIIKVSVGFDGIYQDGNWVPIQIDLSNTGNDFKGKIAVGVPSTPTMGPASITSINTYQEDIDLPPGSQKQVTISVPFNQAFQGSTSQSSINLIDSTNHVIAHKSLVPNTNNAKLTLIGVLSDTPNNFNQLNLAISSLLSTSGQQKNLTAATMPTQAEVLKNFDVLVIDNFTTSTLSQNQLAALQSWVSQGGTLIVTGGPEWKRTLSNLSSNLLPVTVKSNGILPAGTHLLPVDEMTTPNQQSTDTLKSAVAISIAQPSAGSTTLLTAGNIPIITQKKQGQGTTYYLAYDPTIEPLASWSQTSQIWSSLLIRPLADRILTTASSIQTNMGMGNTNTMSWQNKSYNTSTIVTLLQSFFPNAYPSIWLVLLLLISYVLILGPIRLLIIRIFKRRDWTWRIVLGTILAFTLLSYGLALLQKGSSIITSSITIEQLHTPDSTGTTGQATTFVGIFVPSQGDFQVHVPGTSLVQTTDQTNNISYIQNQPANNQQSTFNLGNNGTDIDLQGVNIWTTRNLVVQHDTHTSGAITSQLQLQQNIVSGTVTNSLPYGLSDAFVLIGNTYISLGELPPNSSKQVNINLASNQNQGTNSPLIADQIATSRGMNVSPNGGYPGNNSNYNSLNTARRHASMLEAMSGGYCDSNNNCSNQTMQIFNAGGPIVKTYLNGGRQSIQDPLLLPGSAATIIGWAPSQLIQNGNITVNGQSTNDTQETLVQAPLDLHLTGNVHIASELINSQIVHIQQNSSGNIQEAAPNIYVLTTGSMTFEYLLPANVQIQNSTLAFTSSANANQIPHQTTGATTNINNLQSYLYNWQTGKWDSITFSGYASSVKAAQPYIGPDNRILLHVSNHDSNAIFDKPALDVQGTVSH